MRIAFTIKKKEVTFVDCPIFYNDKYYEEKLETNFFECPVPYIDNYYKEIIQHIDLKFQTSILNSKNEKEIKHLNSLRLDLIDHVKNAKIKVLDRFYEIESKFNQDMSKIMVIKDIKDEIFMDQYCILLDGYEKFGMFDLKCGLLIFSQYEDTLLEDLKYFNLNIIFIKLEIKSYILIIRFDKDLKLSENFLVIYRIFFINLYVNIFVKHFILFITRNKVKIGPVALRIDPRVSGPRYSDSS